MHSHLECSKTGKTHDPGQLLNLSEAGAPLLARYDLPAIANSFTPRIVRERSDHSLWRYHDVLPVENPDDAVTLGEGGTPFLRCERRGPFEPFANLFVKDEGTNPTQSFKARGMTAAVTRAKALGVRTIALPSAGNAAGAAAAYAARAGLGCVLFVPEDTPAANIIESRAAGATTFLVNGLISDCGRLCRAACDEFGWFDVSTLKEPFRIEGKKTMGYELAFDLAAARGTQELQLPDVILYPTGGGTGLIGMWKAFDEMQQLGWIGDDRPRMVVVQAEGCAPIVKAFHDGADHAEMFPNAATVASGLRVPAAVGDFLMLNCLRESGGTALTVTDEELIAGTYELTRHQGIFAAPEGGAVWKAAQALLAKGWIQPDETVVLFNTGSGLKYGHLFEPADLPMIDHTSGDWLSHVADAVRLSQP